MSSKLLIAEDFAAIRAGLEALEAQRRTPEGELKKPTFREYLLGIEPTHVVIPPPQWVVTQGSPGFAQNTSFQVGQWVILTEEHAGPVIWPVGQIGVVTEVSTISGVLSVKVASALGLSWIETSKLKDPRAP